MVTNFPFFYEVGKCDLTVDPIEIFFPIQAQPLREIFFLDKSI